MWQLNNRELYAASPYPFSAMIRLNDKYTPDKEESTWLRYVFQRDISAANRQAFWVTSHTVNKS